MEKTIRIRTKPNDNAHYLKFKLDQKFDFLDVLSLKISQDDVYRKFCAGYGVVVGRVTANDGFGLPNANVSIFIPIDEVDSKDGLISGLYPYEYVSDTNKDNVRYNLLPKKKQNTCHIPVGTFPNKREFIDNDVLLEIYDKYYKFTTTTNKAGDFMLFGIPVGTHTLHMDVDVSDIGVATRRPYDLTRNGSNENQFDTPTKFKDSNDLDSLRQIIRGTTSVDVKPFWGEDNQCDVGINRIDYNLPERIEPAAVFIGSVMTDKGKNSINRRCRARYKTGKICELTTGGGMVEMIRKSITGEIEYKSVKGGRVIDDDGVWVYQVPMNLKPMITDEFGNLIESEDPRKGLFSEADVRFRITMDSTGEEGRIRERGTYLVPHNPDDETHVDYSFDESTNDEHFFKMRWNKIYTIRNFIPRFQGNLLFGADNRAWVGLKEVDRCEDKNNFPYNRMDTDVNPLFKIIMSIMFIIVGIVSMLNGWIIPVINMIIYIINWIIGIIWDIIGGVCEFLGWIAKPSFRCCGTNWSLWEFNLPHFCDYVDDDHDIDYIGCITMDCDQASSTGVDCNGDELSSTFAPGCDCCNCTSPCNGPACGGSGNDGNCTLNFGDGTSSDGYSHPVYSTDGYPAEVINSDSIEYLDCVAAGLADYFEMFTFDFYNDWINGSLYFYLFKYKRDADNHSYCNVDYTCPGSTSGFWCMQNYIVDTSVNPTPTGILAEKTYESRVMFTGLIKKYDDDRMYYAPFGGGHKLYATDITVLGSMSKCDVDGFPYLIDRIPTSTYTIGPIWDTTEVRCVSGETKVYTTESGIMGFSKKPGLFMNVNIAGLYVNYCQSRNVRLQCELGRNIDENGGNLPFVPDDEDFSLNIDVNNMIGMLDVDNWNSDGSGNPCGDFTPPFSSYTYRGIGGKPYNLWEPDGAESQDIFGEYDRFMLRGMNTPNAIANSNFDMVTAVEMYDVGSTFAAHEQFRGFNGDYYGAGDGEYGFGTTINNQPDRRGLPYHNSYYFYFGLKPSKSAINKLRKTFLTDCDYQDKNDFIIDGITTDVTTVGGYNGILEVDVLGGSENYEYEINGPGGYYQYGEEVPDSSLPLTFNNLIAGIYVITIVDSTQGSARAVFNILQPDGIVASIDFTNPAAYGESSGTITIIDINGGGGTTYTITLNGGSPVSVDTSIAGNLPYTYINLVAGTYIIGITNGDQTVGYEVNILEPLEISGSILHTDISCHDVNDGTISIENLTGGMPPFDVSITNSGGYNSSSFHATGLEAGLYTVNVIDVNGTQLPGTPTTVTIVNPPVLDFTTTPSSVALRCNGGPNASVIISTTNPNGPFTWLVSDTEYAGSSVSINNLVPGEYSIKLTNGNECTISKTLSVVEPAQLLITSTSGAACHGGNNGTIFVKVIGGVPMTNYEPYFSERVVGGYAYKLELYDYNNNLVGTEYVLYSYDSVNFVVYVSDDDRAVEFNSSTYNITTGQYTIKLYDYRAPTSDWGCPTEETVTVFELTALSVTLNNSVATEITITATGGMPPYQYRYKKHSETSWSSWSSNSTITGLLTGVDYDVETKDSFNCNKIETIEVT